MFYAVCGVILTTTWSIAEDDVKPSFFLSRHVWVCKHSGAPMGATQMLRYLLPPVAVVVAVQLDAGRAVPTIIEI
jgi:hypothetical protein